jgi:hypothetical protein
MNTLRRFTAATLISLTCGCGQVVVPTDGATDDVLVPDSQSADGAPFDGSATLIDVTHEPIDATTLPDASSSSDATSDSDAGIAGDYPPADIRFTGQACNSMPFASPVRIEDLPGPLPYPLRGGTIADGVYRSRRITRYFDGSEPTPGTIYFKSMIVWISRGEWKVSIRASIREPFDLRVGFYIRANFNAVRESAVRYRNVVVCPADMPQISIVDTFETEGNVLRLQSGDEIVELVRD